VIEPTPALATDLTERQRWRSLAAVIVGSFGVGLLVGAAIPLIALRLEAQGVDATWIGINTAMFPLALLCVGPLLPRAIAHLGPLRSMYLGIAVFAATMLLFPLIENYWAWCALRFVVGIAGGIHWVASETWMNLLASPRNRGRVMAVYATVMAAGFTVGPLVTGWIGIHGWLPFLATFAAALLSVLPLPLAHGVAPVLPAHGRIGLGSAFRAAPLIMAAALAGGVIDASLFSLLPIYGLRAGMEEWEAVAMLSVFIAGSLVLQWPLGWLADHTDRSAVLRGAAIVGAMGALAVPLTLGSGALLWAVLFLLGGTILGVYSLSLGLLGDRFPPGALAAANTAFVMIYEFGSGVGPVLAGGLMDLWHADGLLAVAFAAAVLFLLADWRLRRR